MDDLRRQVPLFSSHIIVSHTDEMFLLDFRDDTSRDHVWRAQADNDQLVVRIALSPEHAKRLLDVLTTNVQKFEKKCGSTVRKKTKKKSLRRKP